MLCNLERERAREKGRGIRLFNGNVNRDVTNEWKIIGVKNLEFKLNDNYREN